MRFFKIILSSILILTIAGCTKSNIGTGAGAVTGGILGSQLGKGKGKIIGTIIGAAGGAFLGNYLGVYMDRQDQLIAQNALQNALSNRKDGNAEYWKGKNYKKSKKIRGYIVPGHRYYPSRVRECRVYTSVVYIKGRRTKANGVACKNGDGPWEIEK